LKSPRFDRWQSNEIRRCVPDEDARTTANFNGAVAGRQNYARGLLVLAVSFGSLRICRTRVNWIAQPICYKLSALSILAPAFALRFGYPGAT
jgi:hypothetical protein